MNKYRAEIYSDDPISGERSWHSIPVEARGQDAARAMAQKAIDTLNEGKSTGTARLHSVELTHYDDD